jgi:hypothetical protein
MCVNMCLCLYLDKCEYMYWCIYIYIYKLWFLFDKLRDNETKKTEFIVFLDTSMYIYIYIYIYV